MNPRSRQRRHKWAARAVGLALVLSQLFPIGSIYASSWDPTLLVNTESFQAIDNGDGTTGIELRFGDSLDGILRFTSELLFVLTRGLRVGGDLTATGSLSIQGASIRGSGSLAMDGNITLNEDDGATDAVLTFGNDAGAETMRFSDTTNSFVFSDDLSIQGQLSGANLSVAGGNVTVSGLGAAVFNENAQDVDFRIEGDSNSNLFFLDAGLNSIGIGTGSAIDHTLEVNGTIGTPDYIDFNKSLGADPSFFEGRVFYDSSEKSLNYFNRESEIHIHMGQESVVLVENGIGSNITKGQVVTITEADGGGIPMISLALADNINTSRALGVAMHDIEDGTHGFVSTFGVLRELNTSSFTAGDTLFLSATTPGAFTNSRPAEPNFSVEIGKVLRSNASLGTIFVKISPALFGQISSGAIPFGGSGAGLDQDASNLVWNDVSNRIGIGTTNASTAVEAVGALTGSTLSIAGGATTIANTSASVFNETGIASNFRIESDTQANMFFVDGTNNRIGIIPSAPETTLDIAGGLSGSTLSFAGGAVTVSDTSTTIFNEFGLASNFRVESDTQSNMFVVDGTNNRVGIATGSPETTLDVAGGISGATLRTAGAAVTFSDAAAVVFNEFGLASNFRIESDTNANMFFVDGTNNRIGVGTSAPERPLDVVGGISGATLNFAGGGVTVSASAAAVFNEFGLASNFRVESDTQANMLLVDGTNNRVGVSTSPMATFDVGGTISGASLRISSLVSCNTINTNASGDLTCGADDEGSTGGMVVKRKTADTLLTDTIVLFEESELSFQMGASETWVFQINMSTRNTNGANDSRYTITAPVGSTCNTVIALIRSSSQMVDSSSCGGELKPDAQANSRHNLMLYGAITTAGTSGSGSFRWAPEIASVGDTNRVFSGTTLFAFRTVGSDLAEVYQTTESDLVPGMVASINPMLHAGLRKSTQEYDTSLLGVISSEPGRAIGGNDLPNTPGTKHVFLALAGRVPVMVTTENGPILPGDYLTSSSMPGIAMKATKPGPTIGQAMTGYDGDDVGVVTVFIKDGFGD